MKKVILFIFVLAGLNGYAQDFKIDSEVLYSGGIISKPPNNVKLQNNCLTRINDSVWLWEPRFFVEDSLGHRLYFSDDIDKKVFTITGKQAGLTPDSLIQLLYKPYLEDVYPGKVTKGKAIFNKK